MKKLRLLNQLRKETTDQSKLSKIMHMRDHLLLQNTLQRVSSKFFARLNLIGMLGARDMKITTIGAGIIEFIST